MKKYLRLLSVPVLAAVALFGVFASLSSQGLPVPVNQTQYPDLSSLGWIYSNVSFNFEQDTYGGTATETAIPQGYQITGNFLSTRDRANLKFSFDNPYGANHMVFEFRDFEREGSDISAVLVNYGRDGDCLSYTGYACHHDTGQQVQRESEAHAGDESLLPAEFLADMNYPIIVDGLGDINEFYFRINGDTGDSYKFEVANIYFLFDMSLYPTPTPGGGGGENPGLSGDFGNNGDGVNCIFCPGDTEGTVFTTTITETGEIYQEETPGFAFEFDSYSPKAQDIISKYCGITATNSISQSSVITGAVDLYENMFNSPAMPAEIGKANLILNGSFENGISNWATGGGFLVDIVSDIASHGSRSAAFNIGQTGAVGDGISQRLRVYHTMEAGVDTEDVTVMFMARPGLCLEGMACETSPPALSVSVGHKQPKSVSISYDGCPLDGDALNGFYYNCAWQSYNVQFTDVGSSQDVAFYWGGSASSLYLDDVQVYHGLVAGSPSSVGCVRPDDSMDTDGDGSLFPECVGDECTFGEPIESPITFEALPEKCIGTQEIAVTVPEIVFNTFNISGTVSNTLGIPAAEICFQPSLMVVEEDKIPFGSFLQDGLAGLGVLAFGFAIVTAVWGFLQSD